MLDLAKTAPSDSHTLDEVSLLLAVTVFILHCPRRVVCSPNVAYPAINAFTQAFQSERDTTVRFKCAQTLQSVFAHEDRAVAAPFIQSLSPKVIEFLLQPASRNVKSEADLMLTSECVKLLETMIRTQDSTESRTQLMEFLLPVLVSHLLVFEEEAAEQAKGGGPFKTRLHEAALARLTQLGQTYPAEFREILSRYPELKRRLEAAALASRARAQAARSETEARSAAAAGARRVEEHKPSIKLTMDFSNFGKK